MTKVRLGWLAGLVVAVLVGVECVRYIGFARAGLIATTRDTVSPATNYTLVLVGCCIAAAVCLVAFVATFRR